MGFGMILRIVMILVGVYLLGVVLFSLARRKMTEPFCLSWGLIAIIIIVAGCVLNPVELNRYISPTGLALVLMLGFCIIFGTYFISSRVSQLMRKNLELSQQLSILKHENDVINEKLEEITKQLEEKAESV